MLGEQNGNDVRQLINIMQLWTGTQKNMNSTLVEKRKFQCRKDQAQMMNNFQACLKLLDPKQAKQLSIREKLEIFFLDYPIMPLFVQESYLHCYSNYKNSPEEMFKAADAAEFVSLGDVIADQVMVKQQWSLMPNLGLMACVAPSTINNNGFCNYCPFPSIMGKMSTMRKIFRMIREIKEFSGIHI